MSFPIHLSRPLRVLCSVHRLGAEVAAAASTTTRASTRNANAFPAFPCCSRCSGWVGKGLLKCHDSRFERGGKQVVGRAASEEGRTHKSSLRAHHTTRGHPDSFYQLNTIILEREYKKETHRSTRRIKSPRQLNETQLLMDQKYQAYAPVEK